MMSMNMKAFLQSGALFVGVALGLTAYAGAADYNFAGVDPPAYYQATGYESVYGSGYNYGGANVVDYRIPELAYGLAVQPSIGVAEQIRLSVGGSVGSAYAGGGSSAIAYGVSSSSYGAGSFGYDVSSSGYGVSSSGYGVSSSASAGEFLTPTSYAQSGDAISADALYPASAFFETKTVHTGGAETAYTSVKDMKRSDGSIGTVKIPSLGITRKVWEGETTTSMSKGMGHYSATSAWDGNVGVCGHNRGATYAIGSIKNLKQGDIITYTTVYGTRTYAVSSVETIANTDWSRLQATSDNCITLTTCLANQPEKRVCVQAVEVR